MSVTFVCLAVFLLSTNGDATFVSYDETACGNSKPRLLTDINGHIESPGWPENYPPYARCEWKIEAEPGSTIYLEFTSFSLEGCGNNCSCDVVKVFDGNSTSSRLLGSFCGTNLPSPITSTGRYLYVQFKTDHSYEQSGFHAKYSSDSACTSSRPRWLTQPSGIITSPFYPNNYPHNSSCHWRIVAPQDQIVRLEFLNFNTEHGYDYVSVYNGADDQPETLLGRFSGPYNPSPLITSLPVMYITFTSNSALSYVGFKARFTQSIAIPALEISLTSLFRAQGNASTIDPDCSDAYAPVFDKKCESMRHYMNMLFETGELCSYSSFRLISHSISFSLHGLEGRFSVTFVLRGSDLLPMREHSNCARAVSYFAQDHVNWGRPLLPQLPGCPFLAFNPECFTDDENKWSCPTS